MEPESNATIKKGIVKIPLKQFCYEEAEKWSVDWYAIYQRIRHRQYPGIRLKRKNGRVVFVMNRPKFNPKLKIRSTTSKIERLELQLSALKQKLASYTD